MSVKQNNYNYYNNYNLQYTFPPVYHVYPQTQRTHSGTVLSDNVMRSFAVPKLTLELPPSISVRLCRYLLVATIPPPTSPLCDCVFILWSALLSLTASLWCVLLLPAASPSTSANLVCIMGIPSVPPAFAFTLQILPDNGPYLPKS